MPIYSMRNTETGEEFEIVMSMAERVVYLEENTHINQIITKAPSYPGDSTRLNGPKPSESFKEVLSHIKSKHKYSTIDY